MRKAFVDELIRIAVDEPRVMLLTGDLGFMVLEEFEARYPDRFVNVGVAEANLFGLATGLARRGFLPFCYSIATFASMRGYEQVRNGPLLHRLPVRIVAVGAGFGYGHAGATHHALEDLALMRAQPGMTVISPGDDTEAATALRATFDLPGAVYYRLAKDPIALPELGGGFEASGVRILRVGRDAALVTAGAMTGPVLDAARALGERGIQVSVIAVSVLQPAPAARLVAALAGHRLVISVEDHYLNGGLGSLCAETIAESELGSRLCRLGVRESAGGRSGSEAWHRRQAGLDVEAIAAEVTAQLTGVTA